MQLKNWGLSDQLVDSDGTGDPSEKRRKASSSGEVKELPAAEQAEHLFRADLDRLAYYLDEIPRLREHLQGRLYVSYSWVGDDWEEYYREEYTEEGWNEICQDFGEDPAQEAFRVPTVECVSIDPLLLGRGFADRTERFESSGDPLQYLPHSAGSTFTNTAVSNRLRRGARTGTSDRSEPHAQFWNIVKAQIANMDKPKQWLKEHGQLLEQAV